MDLNAIVSPYIATVNPWQSVLWFASGAYVRDQDGTRRPRYELAVSALVQAQPLTGADLRQLDGLNLNGEFRAFYVDQLDVRAVDRNATRGGDLFELPDKTLWLVHQVLENWTPTATWVKVAVVKQNRAPNG